MGNQLPMKAVVVPATAGMLPNQNSMQIALSNPDGTAASTVKKQAAQVDSVATTVAGLVTDFNALLAKLRLAGVIS